MIKYFSILILMLFSFSAFADFRGHVFLGYLDTAASVYNIYQSGYGSGRNHYKQYRHYSTSARLIGKRLNKHRHKHYPYGHYKRIRYKHEPYHNRAYQYPGYKYRY